MFKNFLWELKNEFNFKKVLCDDVFFPVIMFKDGRVRMNLEKTLLKSDIKTPSCELENERIEKNAITSSLAIFKDGCTFLPTIRVRALLASTYKMDGIWFMKDDLKKIIKIQELFGTLSNEITSMNDNEYTKDILKIFYRNKDLLDDKQKEIAIEIINQINELFVELAKTLCRCKILSCCDHESDESNNDLNKFRQVNNEINSLINEIKD